ncbi:glycosyltransferase family 22 protein [Neolentinus lepideus HHB14362 ss-1]|uniref:Mannosyltransferase n=1 Tax=Neolentinus lepideus HHB14362 ss-1 TaxID=1314782 RepID=A0A165PTJ9_9AGAM|nr:glycosyltransferase family 22 protein [Neolentinus lepideus HHB14362 ss-1]
MSKLLTRLYAILVVVRILCAFWGTGYIHPDEYFQNGEVTAGDVLGLKALKTWEWDRVSPCRSVIPPFMTTGLAFAVTKILDFALRPRILFLAERSMFLSLSFILDFTTTGLVPNPHSRMYALLLISSSHVVNAFQVRPFSNSLEAVFLSIALMLLRHLLESQRQGYLPLLAIIFVLGAFIRLTFLASAFPIALQALSWTFRHAQRSLSSRCRLILPSLGTALLTALALILCDTLYFHGDPVNPVLTPLNFLLYNLSSKVAAEHGAHPRWLHVAVNLPMIVGPGLMYYAASAVVKDWRAKSSPEDGKVKDNVSLSLNRIMVYVIMITLVVLSVPQHQEPRFLIPLLLPFVVLVVNSGEIYKTGRIFWILWVLTNVILTVLFGFLHQAGVVSSLFHVHEYISNDLLFPGHTEVVYWRTYMPPRHLLGIPEHNVDIRSVSVTDLAGASPDGLLEIIHSITLSTDTRTPLCTKVYLVAPFWATDSVQLDAHSFHLETRIWPHLDMDHIRESVNLGLRDGLALGVYSLQKNCHRMENGRS